MTETKPDPPSGKTRKMESRSPDRVHGDRANKLQWWFMGLTSTLLLTLGAGWWQHVNGRLSSIEQSFPALLREMLRDHESRPHPNSISPREWGSIEARLTRIEQKIDALGR